MSLVRGTFVREHDVSFLNPSSFLLCPDWQINPFTLHGSLLLYLPHYYLGIILLVGREITHSELTLSLLVSGNLLMPSYLSEAGRQSNEPKNRLLQNSKNKSTSDSDKRKINCRNSLWRFVLIPKRRFPNYKNLKSSVI